MRTSFISLILLLLLGACSRPEVTERLAHAERIMNAHPDSALQLLRAIDAPHKLRGKDRADYAWLLTQAYDKNYLDSLQSDSLIALATDYYADNADAVRAGKAFFYQGKVLALQGKDSLAMVSYLEAGRRLENTDEHQMNARTQEYIGHLYKDNDLDAKALVYYRKAIPYYTMINDSLGLAHSYTSIAKLFYNKQDYDSLYKYANMAIEFINHDSTKMPFSSLMKLLGDVERRKKNYQKATSYYESAIRSCRYAGNLPSYYISLGEVCLATNNLKQAESYFIKITTLPNVNKWSLAGANHYLYEIEKQQKHFHKALVYKEISDSLLILYNRMKYESQLLQVKHNYETTKLQLDKLILEHRVHTLIYFGVCITLLVMSISYYFYINYKEILRKKEQLIYNLEKEEKSRQQRLKIMNRHILCVENENKQLKESPHIIGMYLVEQLRKQQLTIDNLNENEINQFFAYIDLTFHDFTMHIKSHYDLKRKNIFFICLILLKFDINELAFIFDCDPQSIKRKIKRLKETLKLDKNENLYSFLLNFFLDLSKK